MVVLAVCIVKVLQVFMEPEGESRTVVQVVRCAFLEPNSLKGGMLTVK